MPSFNPFSSVRGTNSTSLFEIRLETDVIVLRGAENEAASQMLRGVVVLCLPSSLKVDDVHLRMTGTSKIGWHETRVGASGNRCERTAEIFNHRWAPFVGGQGSGSSSKGVTLAGGNYEWPFELVISGATVESVEGLAESYITYKLKATLARGKLAYDLHAYKPVRIIRTLDPAALELAHAMTVENVWPNKVEYSLVIPQKAIIFGTSISVEMKFTSLLKGLKIGRIKCELVESQEFVLFPSSVSEQRHKSSREIANWEFNLNEEEHYHDMMTEAGQDGYVLNGILPLPKSLRKCLQDVETPGIKIRHKVKFNVQLHNPDGHTSELRATLPVTIFISPNMPIDESGNLLDQTPNSTQSDDIHSHAPPLYGEHILDQLYADIDPSGLRTPAPQSGMNTPFYSQSRSGSADNITSLGRVAQNAIRPDALENRLHDLSHNSRHNSLSQHQGASGYNTPQLDESGSNSNSGDYYDPDSIPRSNPLSRRTSEEDNPSPGGVVSGVATPQHIDYSDLDLCKVPSYTTAVRTPVRGMSSQDLRSLPNYQTAISAPPSPELGESHLTGSGRARENGNGGANATNGRLVNMTGRRSSSNTDSDASRRVLLMQARGRT